MRYSKYPSYRDSGTQWLGKVPEHWTSIKFKQAFMHKTKTTNHRLDCGSISFGNVVYKDNDKIPEETRASYQEVLDGEFLINPLNLNFDLKSLRTALSKLNVVVSTGYIVLQGKSDINKNYLRWLLFQFDVAHMKTLGAGVRQTVNFTDIGNEYFRMPPLQEQQTIANYLDNATAKIDTLIQKQTKLIELLKEKRQAVISTAVTRGLDSSVAMKDSGVEWLGEIPIHWEVKKLKHIGEAIIGLTYSPSNIVDENEGTLVLRSSNLQGGGLYYGDNVYVNSDIPYKLITRAGDIVICSRNGSRKLIGKNAMIDKESEGVSFGAFTSVFRSNQNPFVFYILNSSLFKYQSGRFMTTTINQLTTGTLNAFQIALPPVGEQLDIVEYLHYKTTKIDTLITKSTKAIDLLKEKRTALISSCVTGKIDVRKVA